MIEQRVRLGVRVPLAQWEALRLVDEYEHALSSAAAYGRDAGGAVEGGFEKAAVMSATWAAEYAHQAMRLRARVLDALGVFDPESEVEEAA